MICAVKKFNNDANTNTNKDNNTHNNTSLPAAASNKEQL
jgi:hypothetical protein